MLVIFDGDGTLWEGDVLSGYLTTPFSLLDENTVEDFDGRKVKLKEEVREVLEELQKKKVYIALANESRDVPVISLLRKLKIDQYFNFLKIEWADKDVMLLEILNNFKKHNIELKKIVFVDDFEYNIKLVKENPELSKVRCVYAKELKNLRDVLEMV